MILSKAGKYIALQHILHN